MTRRAPGLWTAALLALAACVQAPAEQAEALQGAPLAQAQAAPQVAALPRLVPEPEPAPPPPPPPPTMELAEFLDLTSSEIVALLGNPDLLRDEPGVSAWQFVNGDDCVLHVFLYALSPNSSFFTVEHAEVLPEDASPARVAACVTALLVRGAARQIAGP